MRPQLARRMLGLLLVVSIAFVAVGVMPDSAKAITTSYVYRQVMWLKSQVASIKSINTSQASAITWLEAQITALRAADVSNSAADAAQRADIAALQSQVAALGARLASAETTITSLRSRVTILEAANSGATSAY